jgi:hypothetical protein
MFLALHEDGDQWDDGDITKGVSVGIRLFNGELAGNIPGLQLRVAGWL